MIKLFFKNYTPTNEIKNRFFREFEKIEEKVPYNSYLSGYIRKMDNFFVATLDINAFKNHFNISCTDRDELQILHKLTEGFEAQIIEWRKNRFKKTDPGPITSQPVYQPSDLTPQLSPVLVREGQPIMTAKERLNICAG